jgi:hypothetical protein
MCNDPTTGTLVYTLPLTKPWERGGLAGSQRSNKPRTTIAQQGYITLVQKDYVTLVQKGHTKILTYTNTQMKYVNILKPLYIIFIKQKHIEIGYS